MVNKTPGKDMTGWSGLDILAATGGELLSGDPATGFSGVGIDSRRLAPGALFVAIVGKNHDGHGFCVPLIAAGGRGVLVEQGAVGALPLVDWRKRSVFCVVVPDTARALGDLAAYRRTHHQVRVVGVTGSCGKTTTREMIVSVLGQCFETLSSRKNFNNEIGLPLTLLNVTADHQWVVAELGMNRPGEIARLGEICRPDIGLITNVGPAHLEGLGSVDRVMDAKGELLPAILPGGTAVLNADDPRGLILAGRARGNTLLFGESPRAGVRAREVICSGAQTRFELMLPEQKKVWVTLGVPGRFMVSNALAAAAVGHLAGLDADRIQAGLAGFKPVSGRMQVIATRRGIHVLDDSYNANPLSMAAAIETLGVIREGRRGVLVLGDMQELGPGADDFHREVGAMAADSGVARVFATGRFADRMADGACGAGQLDASAVVTGTPERILTELKRQLSPGDWVLVKGSRASGMETIVAALVEWAGGVQDAGESLPARPM